MTTTATWTRSSRRRWILHDAAGTERGIFHWRGLSLRHTEAQMDGQDFGLTARGFLTRRVQVTDANGQILVTGRIGAIRWRGELTLKGTYTYPLARKIGFPSQFVVGDPDRPLIVMAAHLRRGELTFHPDLPGSTPELLPTMLLVLLLHQNSSAPR